MRRFVEFLSGKQPVAPLPLPVTVQGIWFPADGSTPHMLWLTTTTDAVKDGPDAPWGHVPDLRRFWLTRQARQWRDNETFRLSNQPVSSCDGLHVTLYSFDAETLPVHSHFPHAVFGRQRTFAGHVFVAKLQGREIGEDLGEDGWAVWLDVPSEVLSLPVMSIPESAGDHHEQ